MTIYALVRRIVALLFVFICHVRACVFVTAEAGVRTGIAARVTGCAGHGSAFTMIKREGVIEGGGSPGCGRVTGRAIRAVLAAVAVIAGMTGVTIRRRTLKDVVDMALGTGRAGMLSGQREGRIAVIEGGRLPA